MEEHEDDGCYRNGHLENWRKRERESLISQRDEMNSLNFLRHQKKYEAFFDAYGMSLQSTD